MTCIQTERLVYQCCEFSISTSIETSTQIDSTKVADNHRPNRWTVFILHIAQELYVACTHMQYHGGNTCLFLIQEVSLLSMCVSLFSKICKWTHWQNEQILTSCQHQSGSLEKSKPTDVSWDYIFPAYPSPIIFDLCNFVSIFII